MVEAIAEIGILIAAGIITTAEASRIIARMQEAR